MIKQCLAALLALCFATGVFAQETSTKIAVLNQQKAVLDTVAAKNRLKAMIENADFVANKKEYDDAVAARRALLKKAQKEAPTMTQEQQAELAGKIQEKEADAKHAAGKLKAAEQKVAREILVDNNQSLMAAVSKIIETENIGILMPSESLLYGDPALDITNRVTELMNAAE